MSHELDLYQAGLSADTWRRAKKKPIEVRFREVIPPDERTMFEIIRTKEGQMTARVGEDYIIEGIEGEIYPIDKEIFIKSFEVIE